MVIYAYVICPELYAVLHCRYRNKMVGVNCWWSNSFTELSLYIYIYCCHRKSLLVCTDGDLIVGNELCTVYIAVTETTWLV